MSGALEMMSSVPTGCIVFPVSDNDAEPLLKLGEFAVVDTNDRDPVVGEVYVIEQNSVLTASGRRRRVVQVCLFGDCTLEDGSPALMVGPYARNQHIPGYGMTRMLDGAYRAEGLKRSLIGRVVGIYAVQS